MSVDAPTRPRLQSESPTIPDVSHVGRDDLVTWQAASRLSSSFSLPPSCHPDEVKETLAEGVYILCKSALDRFLTLHAASALPMSLLKKGSDEWTPTGIKSTFWIIIPASTDPIPPGTVPSAVCGLGWRFLCSANRESNSRSTIFVDADGNTLPAWRIAILFDPHLVRSADYGVLSFSVHAPNLLVAKDACNSNTLTLPNDQHRLGHASSETQIATYIYTDDNRRKIAPTVTIAAGLSASTTLSIPRSIDQRLEHALVDSMRRAGYVARPEAIFAQSSLLEGYSESLDVLISGGGFTESRLFDLDGHKIDQDILEDYDYMSDSDLDTDDEDEHDFTNKYHYEICLSTGYSLGIQTSPQVGAGGNIPCQFTSRKITRKFTLRWPNLRPGFLKRTMEYSPDYLLIESSILYELEVDHEYRFTGAATDIIEMLNCKEWQCFPAPPNWTWKNSTFHRPRASGEDSQNVVGTAKLVCSYSESKPFGKKNKVSGKNWVTSNSRHKEVVTKRRAP
ncbi:hypothetical protein DFH09DRAFT_1441566 [Mycena vulgaris]|nr:hypothetical protein DFH09DRAFT_1441566 [Mycena vulgaris]